MEHEHAPSEIVIKTKNGEVVMRIVWCVQCGAIKLNDASDWNLPLTMSALIIKKPEAEKNG